MQNITSLPDAGLLSLIADAVLILKRRGRVVPALDALMREIADIHLEQSLGSLQGAVSVPPKRISRHPRPGTGAPAVAGGVAGGKNRAPAVGGAVAGGKNSTPAFA